MEKYSKEEIESLVFFYVNGSLKGDELDAFEARLESDQDLRKDVETLLELRSRILPEENDELLQRNLATLLQKIRQEPREQG